MTVDSPNLSGTRHSVLCAVTLGFEYCRYGLSANTDADTQGLLGTSLTLLAGR